MWLILDFNQLIYRLTRLRTFNSDITTQRSYRLETTSQPSPTYPLIAMSVPAQPCINPNPDIAGIGVRVSVYTQAFLNLACIAIFSIDGWISAYENAVLTTT
jgi:hypothetical protein